MLVRTSGIKARLSALETYVGEKKESRGMTLTSRLEAQHRILVALNENQSETNRRLTSLEGRVTNLEGAFERLQGMVLHGMTEIKNLLKRWDDPPGSPPPNGAPPPG